MTRRMDDGIVLLTRRLDGAMADISILTRSAQDAIAQVNASTLPDMSLLSSSVVDASRTLTRTVRQLGASGACVYIKDLRRPPSPEAVLALQQRYLADAPPVLQHDYIASLHAAFSPDEVHAQLEAAGLAQQLQVGALDDRYLEVWGRLL